jgi:uncharacterized LabA/DUF88 family protein
MNQDYNTNSSPNTLTPQESSALVYGTLLQSIPLMNMHSDKWLASNLLASATYRFRSTEALLTNSGSLPEVDVRIDFENLYLGMEQQGLTTDLEQIIAAIQLAAAEPGGHVTMVAYADWYALFKRASFEVQYALRRMGVEICDVASQRGKNSSDMRIVDDVRTLIEQDSFSPNSRRKIVLVTGDSDFCTIVKTSQTRGHKVSIISLRSCLSRALEQAANEVRYLDDLLAPQANDAVNEITEVSAYAGLVMRIVHQLHQHNWKWTYIDKLALPRFEEELLRQAILAGIFIRSERIAFDAGQSQHAAATITPNNGHPLVKVIHHLIEWLPDRIAYCLNEKHMPYVDSNFLARGMALDKILQQLGAGQNREEAEEWLGLAASIGVITKKQQSHPGSPSKIINTWWLPQENCVSNVAYTSHQQFSYAAEPESGAYTVKTSASSRIKSTHTRLPKSVVHDMPLNSKYLVAYYQSTATRPVIPNPVEH